MVGLTMGNDLLAQIHAMVFQKPGHVRQQPLVILWVLQQQPVHIHSTWNMSGAGRATAQTLVFFSRTDIPDLLPGVVDGRENSVKAGTWPFVQCDGCVAGSGRFTCTSGQFTPGCCPGVDPAVEITPVTMTNHVQRPGEASSPAAPFVIIENEIGGFAVAQPGKEAVQPAIVRQFAAGGCNTGNQLARCDVDRAGNMMRCKGCRIGDMNQAPVVVGLLQDGCKLGRFNQGCLWFEAGNRRSPSSDVRLW